MSLDRVPMIKRNAYVYAVVVDGLVRYIGKGSGRYKHRAREHQLKAKRIIRRRLAGERFWVPKLYNKLASAIEKGSSVRELVLADDLSHKDAFAEEVRQIKAVPSGQLWNMDEGGRGGNTFSEEHRRKLSVAAKRRWKRDSELERMRGSVKRFMNLPTTKELNSRRMKEYWAEMDVETRELRLKKFHSGWYDPDKRKNIMRGLQAGWRSKRRTLSCLTQ